MVRSYNCKQCKKKFTRILVNDKNAIDKHMNTDIHKMNSMRYFDSNWRDTEPSPNKYNCKLCDKYVTMKKDKIVGHINTNKHERILKEKHKKKENIDNINIKKYECPICEVKMINSKDSIDRHSLSKKHSNLMKKAYLSTKGIFLP